MKRYLLFCYDTYYPIGGWNDFKGSYSTLAKAQEHAGGENAHVVDRNLGCVAWKRGEDESGENQ